MHDNPFSSGLDIINYNCSTNNKDTGKYQVTLRGEKDGFVYNNELSVMFQKPANHPNSTIPLNTDNKVAFKDEDSKHRIPINRYRKFISYEKIVLGLPMSLENDKLLMKRLDYSLSRLYMLYKYLKSKSKLESTTIKNMKYSLKEM